ncbi:MAG: helix-hairpin-helix domain-containing protein, partial [Candidatus Thorarchaeota archaeon]
MNDEGTSLRLAAFSDWRVQPFGPLLDWMKSVNPDYAVYAGDDTVRMADFSIDALRMILEDDSLCNIAVGYGIVEDLKIEYGTLKKFENKIKKEIEELLTTPSPIGFHRRHPWGDYQGTDPIWLGPPPRKKGFCLYYNRLSKSWIAEIAAATANGLGAVVGNDCDYSDKLRLVRNRVSDLHSKPVIIDDVAFLGLEGSSGDIGFILYAEEDAQKHLEQQWNLVSEKDPEFVVLVTHAPPKGVLDLSRRFGINNIGSTAVREFISVHDVDLVVCGHSHINGGRIQSANGCTVLNIASHDYNQAPGLVALIELEKGAKLDIEVQRLFDNDLVLQSIHKVGMKRASQLFEMGIKTLDDICKKNVGKMVTLHGVGSRLVNRWILEASTLKEGKAYRIDDPKWEKLESKNLLIYDIETDTTISHIWCIGVWNGKEREFVQFFQKRDEPSLLRDFFAYAKRFPRTIPVTFSSTDFDRRVVSYVAHRHKLKLPS